MSASRQLRQEYRGKTLGLWILETNLGRKRTWKADQQAAVQSALRRGLTVLSIRVGTEKDKL